MCTEYLEYLQVTPLLLQFVVTHWNVSGTSRRQAVPASLVPFVSAFYVLCSHYCWYVAVWYNKRRCMYVCIWSEFHIIYLIQYDGGSFAFCSRSTDVEQSLISVVKGDQLWDNSNDTWKHFCSRLTRRTVTVYLRFRDTLTYFIVRLGESVFIWWIKLCSWWVVFIAGRSRN